MKRELMAGCILFLAVAGVGSAQATASPADNSTSYSKVELKQLVRDAHTPEQYNVLAGYYTQQQRDYLKQAEEERQEWVRRSQNTVGVAAKYPRPVDSARSLCEYYTYKANEAGELASKYRELAAPKSPAALK